MLSKCKCGKLAQCSCKKCNGCCTKRHRLGSYTRRITPKPCKPGHGAIGIEMEMEGGMDLIAKLHTVVCYDGSLDDGGEVKMVAGCCKIAPLAAHVAELATHLRCRATRRCGMHVHLDTRGFLYTRKHDIGTWMQQHRQWWRDLIPESRKHNDHIEWTENVMPSSHYAWFNFTRYNTMELRIHPGSHNPHKVYAWLRFMRLIVHKMRDETLWANSKNPLQDLHPLKLAEEDKVVLHYLKARIDNHGRVPYYKSPYIPRYSVEPGPAPVAPIVSTAPPVSQHGAPPPWTVPTAYRPPAGMQLAPAYPSQLIHHYDRDHIRATWVPLYETGTPIVPSTDSTEEPF